MSGEQPGEHAKAAEIGWSGFKVSLPVALLGRGGLLAILILWTLGQYIPLNSLRETLILALVPMAVIFGFGLKRFEEIGDLLRARPSLDNDSTRGRFLQVVLVYGASVTALTAVLVYSLIPEFELPDTLPPDLLGGLDLYRFLTLGVATLVLLPAVLIVRYPFLTMGNRHFTAAVDRPSMSPHWRQRRGARCWDMLMVLPLYFLDILVLALLGQWLPREAYLVELVLVGFLYEAACALFRGCTVGKWRRGVRVVGLDGNPASRWRALGRAAVLYAPPFSFGLLQMQGVPGSNSVVLWTMVLVLYGLAATHPYGRGLHDLVAGTRITTQADPEADTPDDGATSGQGAESPTRAGELRLPRPEFEATPDDPFGRDKLHRQSHVEGLCHWIEASAGHPVVMVDAEWGAGKTAFMTMCHAYLTSRGRQVVAYNAWRAGYTQQPLFDIVASVATQLPGPDTDAMTNSAARVSSLRSIWAELRSPDISEVVDMSELPAETQRVLAEFHERLGSVSEAGSGPLVVLIDELDRCRPTYALETLEAVRHLFSVDGVVVVIATNREQLTRAVEGLYGANFDADRYLDRFVDLTTTLSIPDHETLVPFLTELTTETGLSAHMSSADRTHRALRLVADLADTQLRDLEHATHLATTVLSSRRHPAIQRELWEWSVLALVVLRMADQSAYADFVSGRIDGFGAVGKLNGALPHYLLDGQRAVTRQCLEAALIHASSLDDWRATDRTDYFLSQYENQAVRSARRAKVTLVTLRRILPPYPGPVARVQVSQVAALMDLAAYAPDRAT